MPLYAPGVYAHLFVCVIQTSVPGLGLSLLVSFKVKSSILDEKVSWYGDKSADLHQKHTRERKVQNLYYTRPV